jgi:hypothetical protein
MTDVPDDFAWPPPWRPLPFPPNWLGKVPSVETELQREVPPRHLLNGRTCRVVAYNPDHSDEFLFITDAPNAPIAFVHLTWQAERDPMWPYTVAYPGWEAFRLAWLNPQD